MTKTNTIIWLVVVIVILLFVNFANFWSEKIPDDLNEMSAGQLLDVKINYDEQIKELEYNRQEVIDIYNIKRWRVNTGTTVDESWDTAIELVNEALGL